MQRARLEASTSRTTAPWSARSPPATASTTSTTRRRPPLYVGAAKAGKLTVATLDAKGALTPVATVPTKAGARNGVVDRDGNVYLAHAKGSELVVVGPEHH